MNKRIARKVLTFQTARVGTMLRACRRLGLKPRRRTMTYVDDVVASLSKEDELRIRESVRHWYAVDPIMKGIAVMSTGGRS